MLKLVRLPTVYSYEDTAIQATIQKFSHNINKVYKGFDFQFTDHN